LPIHLRKWQAGRERGITSVAPAQSKIPTMPHSWQVRAGFASRLPAAVNMIFNFEFRSKSWTASTISLDRQQSFVPDRPLDRPRSQRKVKRQATDALGCAACGHQQHLRTQRARQDRPQRPGPPHLRSHRGRPAPTTPPARAPASMRRPDPGQRLARWKRSRSHTTNTQTDTGTGDRRRPKTVPAMIGYPARR
jgi:hypothetical protein